MDGVIKLNGPKGLGDAIYMRAMARHLLASSRSVSVRTRWPEVFCDLPVTIVSADVEPDDYHEMRHMTACLNCQVPQIRVIDKFRLACLQAGFDERVALSLGWSPRNLALLDQVRSASGGRPILLFQPLKRSRNTEQELLRPRPDAFARVIAGLSGFFRIKIGHRDYVAPDDHPPCELDLIGRLSVPDVFDLATVSAQIVGESNYLPLLAEAIDKPFIRMFSRRALASNIARVANESPQRAIHKPHLATVVFDEEPAAA